MSKRNTAGFVLVGLLSSTLIGGCGIVFNPTIEGETATQTAPTEDVKLTKSQPANNSKIDYFTLKPNQSNKPVLINKDDKGNPLMYPSFDKKSGKVIKVHVALQVPPNFDPVKYDRPIVILGHDGYDLKMEKTSWDPELDPINYFVKNAIRLSPDMAKSGSLVIVPAYRGENQSEGSIDVAGADVMDTISAIRFSKALLPDSNKSEVTLSGTSRGGLTSLMTAYVYPVNKVVTGYSVNNFDKWIKAEANCDNDSKCLNDRKNIHPDYKSWEEILDSEAIAVAKNAHGGQLPVFTRNAVEIAKYANPSMSIYIGQGQYDTSVKEYHAHELAAQLNKIKVPHVVDIYRGQHVNREEGTHGIYTRKPRYVDPKNGPSLQKMKTKFVAEATSVAKVTPLK
ncbi:MAG: alpha/beta hydrolase family protein [Patescibacteria group bacterium]